MTTHSRILDVSCVEVSDGSYSADRVCKALTLCDGSQYVKVAHNKTMDRTCATKQCNCVCKDVHNRMDWCPQQFFASGAACPKHRGDMCTGCPAGMRATQGGKLCERVTSQTKSESIFGPNR